MANRDALRVRSAAGAHFSVARELAEMVTSALLSPPSAREPGSLGVLRLTSGLTCPDRPPILTPVVLVPGYGGNRCNWQALERELQQAGFENLIATAYNPMTTDVPVIAAGLVEACQEAMDEAGVSRVHLIGHSLGGVVVRYAVGRLGLAASTGSAVTIASPHRGAAVARLGRGAAAVDVRPGSAVLAELSDPPADAVRWVAYYSNLDVVVPPRSARLDDPALRARNILVPDEGHLSILRAPALRHSVVAELLAAEDAAAPSAASLGEALSLAS